MPGTYPSYTANTQDTQYDIPGRTDIANGADYNAHDTEILSHQSILLNHEGRIVTLETGGVTSYWDRSSSTLRPHNSGDSVNLQTGNMTANSYYGDGSHLTGVASSGHYVPYIGASGEVDLGFHDLSCRDLTASGDIRANNINSWVSYDNPSDLTLSAAIFHDVLVEGGSGYTAGDGGGVQILGGNGGYFGGVGGDVTIAVGKPQFGTWTSAGAGQIIFKGVFNWKYVPNIDYQGTINILSTSSGVPHLPDVEYITNGSFGSSTGWSEYPTDSNWVIADGVATNEGDWDMDGSTLYQNLTTYPYYLVTGQWYDVTYTVVSIIGYTAQITVKIGDATDSVGVSRTAAGTYTETLRASSTQITFQATGYGYSGTPAGWVYPKVVIDNVSLKVPADFTKGKIYASGNDLVITNPYPTRGGINLLNSNLVTTGDSSVANSYLSASGIFQDISVKSVNASGNISSTGDIISSKSIHTTNGLIIDNSSPYSYSPMVTAQYDIRDGMFFYWDPGSSWLTPPYYDRYNQFTIKANNTNFIDCRAYPYSGINNIYIRQDMDCGDNDVRIGTLYLSSSGVLDNITTKSITASGNIVAQRGNFTKNLGGGRYLINYLAGNDYAYYMTDTGASAGVLGILNISNGKILEIGKAANIYLDIDNLGNLSTSGYVACLNNNIYSTTADDTNSRNIVFSKSFGVDSTHIEWDFTHRSNNKDFWLYGYDGTNFKMFLECLWDTQTIDFTSTKLLTTGTLNSGPATITYAGADGTQALTVDASDSSLDATPAFKILTPSTGLQKGFQITSGSDGTAWASFERSAGGTNKPGFAFGAGGSTARDVNIYRNSANVLKTDDSFIAASEYLTASGVFKNISTESITASGNATITGDLGVRATTLSGTLTTSGGVIGKITTVTDTYIVQSVDETIVCNKSTAFTVTLPTAVIGQIFYIKNIGLGIVTVDGASSDTIDGNLTQSLHQWDCMEIQCYAANSWAIK